jgi:NADH-quinone oxidoreductase subunit J
MDTIIFWGAAAVAVISTLFVIVGKNPFTAVLFLILSLFGISMIFYTLGAPFLAALEIIVYAGAIMVLFLFVVQMLSPAGSPATSPDISRPKLSQAIIPGFLALVLLVVLCLAVVRAGSMTTGDGTYVVSAKALGMVLFKKHYLGVELASLILLIGIVGGMHLGRAASIAEETELDVAIR